MPRRGIALENIGIGITVGGGGVEPLHQGDLLSLPR
jgi:hypothetical protein